MEIPSAIVNRKGVRKAADIKPEVLALLEEGRIETVNLTEWLAVDQLKVLQVVLKALQWEAHYPVFETAVNAQKKPSANSNTKVIGAELAPLSDDPAVFQWLRNHSSDIVRCWACWAEAIHANSTAELLDNMQPYAADRHFGVREVVIFASKDRLVEDLSNAINLLREWSASADENVRRYTAEVLRPNGVWTKKVDAFHQNPELGLPLIAPLNSDPSKYVQNSVANWLNEASKSNPDWVRKIADAWGSASSTKATAYIVKRALRTINK